MPRTVQHRRGTTATVDAITPAAGELLIDTTLKTIRIGDGTTAGGATRTANTVLAGPATGAADQEAFRALVAADVPDISSTYLTVATAASTYQPIDTDLTTLAGLSPTRGGLIIGTSAPAWAVTAVGGANSALTSNGTDAAWSTTPTLAGLTLATTPLAVGSGGTGLATATANVVFAGPTSGGAAAPTWRSLVAADIPSLSSTYQPVDSDLTTIAGLSVARGSLMVGSAAPAWSALAVGTIGKLLVSDGNDPGWRVLATTDIPDISATYLTVVTAGSTYQPLDADLTQIAALSNVLGDLLYTNVTPEWARLAGNTTATKKFLTQTGTGAVSAAPGWDTIIAGDIPDISATYALTGHTHAGVYQPVDADLTTIAALTCTRGAVMTGSAAPAWQALAVGAAGSVLYSDGTDSSFSTTPYVTRLGVGVAAGATSPLTIKSTSALESGVLGTEFLGAAGWTSTDWTGSWAAGWTHTAGNTTVLSQSTAAVSGTYYQIAYTITGRTAGTIVIAFGGQTNSAVSASGAWGPRATSTANLTVTPTTDFDGAVVLSIKPITASTATFALLDSAGNATWERRSSLASLNNEWGGRGSGGRNTTGYSNAVGAGLNALANNTTGYNNSVGAGLSVLQANTTGYWNSVGAGLSVLQANITGSYNSVGAGVNALQSNTTGTNNSVGAGVSALQANTTGNSNSVGAGANGLYYNTTGSANTASGVTAGAFHADGSTPLTDPESGVYIGAYCRGFSNADNHTIVIGADAIATGAYQAVIGHVNQTLFTTYGTIAGVYNDAVTNAVTYGLHLQHATSGTAAANFGTGIKHTLESAAGTARIAATEEVIWTTATDGAEVAVVNHKVMTGGAAAATYLQVGATTQIGTPATNATQFAVTGRQTMIGTGRIKKDISVSFSAIGAGASSPTLTRLGNVAGYAFTIGDDGYIQFEVPDNWDSTTTIGVSIHGYINEAYVTAPSGEIRFTGAWAAIPEGGGETVDAPTHTGTLDSGDVNIPATAKHAFEISLGTIAAASLAAHDLVCIKLERVALVGGNNPTAEPVICHAEYEYTANSLGAAV